MGNDLQENFLVRTAIANQGSLMVVVATRAGALAFAASCRKAPYGELCFQQTVRLLENYFNSWAY